jgi:hypothetical protein
VGSTCDRPLRGNLLVTEYFRSVMWAIVADCERLHQSGFAMCWPSLGEGCDILSWTVFTVNQDLVRRRSGAGGWRAAGLRSAARLGRVQRNRFALRFDDVH